MQRRVSIREIDSSNQTNPKGFKNVDTDSLFSVAGKTAIVTGASSGLGVTFAESLAERGANVVLVARRKDKLSELINKMNSKGLSTTYVTCDVTESAEVNQMFEEAVEKYDRVDVLVNNAGHIAEAGTVPEKITDDMILAEY